MKMNTGSTSSTNTSRGITVGQEAAEAVAGDILACCLLA